VGEQEVAGDVPKICMLPKIRGSVEERKDEQPDFNKTKDLLRDTMGMKNPEITQDKEFIFYCVNPNVKKFLKESSEKFPNYK